MASAPAARQRPRRARDVGWLILAIFLGFLFVLEVIAAVVAVVRLDARNALGAPVTLLFLYWVAVGSWRRTRWGALDPQAQRRFDLRAFGLFLPDGYTSYSHRPGADVIVGLRSIIVVLTLVLVALGTGLASVIESAHAPVAPWIALLGGLAVANYALARFITTRPLDCTSDATLAAGYVTAACLRITFAASLALFAYTFAFIGEAAWIYDVGAAIALGYLWSQVAPIRRMIDRDQRRISAQGCERSLVAALRAQSP